MDNEEVVAYIHSFKLWRKMNNAERKGWQTRARYVLTLKDQAGKPWTQRRLAPLLGIDNATLSRRLAWSEPQEVLTGQSATTLARQDRAVAKAIKENPDAVREMLETVPTPITTAHESDEAWAYRLARKVDSTSGNVRAILRMLDEREISGEHRHVILDAIETGISNLETLRAVITGASHLDAELERILTDND